MRRQDRHRTVSKRTEWTTHGLREGRGTNEAARPSLDRFEGTRTDHSPTKGEMRDDRGGKTISKRNRMDHAQTEGGTKWQDLHWTVSKRTERIMHLLREGRWMNVVARF